jgi:thiol-disulfide isomerase/thioredoxin
MKRTLPFLLLLVSAAAFGQGYEIQVTLKPFKNQYVYLGHYYGKQLPIVDSVKLDANSRAVFKGKKKLGGGIYLIGYPDRAHHFEVLVDDQQKFSVVADTVTIGKQIAFTNSPGNVLFLNYQQAMSKAGRQMDSLSRLRSANPADSVRLTARMQIIDDEVKNYRLNLMAKNPNSLLTLLLRAMKEPEIPKQPAANKDTLYNYHYFKAHFWDGVNLYDDRLVRTPFFEAKVDKYFDQLVYPAPDSVIKEIDYIMGFAGINKEMEKFFLLKFVNRYLNQKYMWEDKVFVHLFERYFAQKQYEWMSDKGRKIVQDRAYSLMSNIFGNPAADVDLPDSTGKSRTLYSVEATYTLLVIWDPTCGHCKETLPKLDSMYQARWKALGLQPYALAKETDGTRKDWLTFISDHKLTTWVNVYYSKEADRARVDHGTASYSQLFDVQTFPTLYLLDKEKRIIAKKVTPEQIDEILAVRQKNGK